MASRAGCLTTRATTLPILTFHALDDRHSAISYPPKAFQRGLAQLSVHRIQTIDPVDAARAMQTHTSFQPHSVITFDDGFQTVYTEAFPFLRDLGMASAVFLAEGRREQHASANRLPSLDGQTMLSRNEICEMQRHGFTFGAHTLTHPDLCHLSDAQIEAEMLGSKVTIEQELGAPVECFAYPFGCCNMRSYAIARDHFSCACSEDLGVARADSDAFALERVDAYYLRTRFALSLVPTRWFVCYVRACNIPRRLRRAMCRGVLLRHFVMRSIA